MSLQIAGGNSADSYVLDEEGSLEGKSDNLLIQRLLAKATHPSPIKAMFSIEELEAAALDVSQYLASAAAAKKTNLGSPVADGPSGAAEDSWHPEFSNDTAAAAASKTSLNQQKKARSNSVASAEGRPPPPRDHYPTGEAVTSRDLRISHRRRRYARGQSRAAKAAQQQQHPPPQNPSPPPPPTATVRQLVEMGFPRAAVERAVKAIDGSGGLGELGPSPESIVAWLLEHPDQVRKSGILIRWYFSVKMDVLFQTCFQVYIRFLC